MNRAILILCLGLMLILLAAPLGVAQASRASTPREAREIRVDAKLYLTGRGWKVSGIRVATVNNHYAKAAVLQSRTGVAGEMILKLRHGIWHQAFMGTNDFCSAPVPRRVLGDLGFRC